MDNTQRKKLQDGREYRSMTMTVRAAQSGQPDDGQMIVEGYAATFNKPYVIYESAGYKIVESIAPTAFEGCDMSDVIFQYDHMGRVFARNKNGTLQVEADSIGLKVTADLSGTEAGRQLYNEIRGGYTDKMSFGFAVGADRKIHTEENGVEICTRTITKVAKLYDVSAVSLPANDMTSISVRALSDGWIGELQAERLKRADRIRKIKLLTEV